MSEPRGSPGRGDGDTGQWMADLSTTDGDDAVDLPATGPGDAAPAPGEVGSSGDAAPTSDAETARRRYPSWPLIVMALVALVATITTPPSGLPYRDDALTAS